MPLNAAQRRVLEEWMRSKAIITCPACGQEEKWRLADAAYVRALLEEGKEDLMEDAGVVKIRWYNCGYLALIGAETCGVGRLGEEVSEL